MTFIINAFGLIFLSSYFSFIFFLRFTCCSLFFFFNWDFVYFIGIFIVMLAWKLYTLLNSDVCIYKGLCSFPLTQGLGRLPARFLWNYVISNSKDSSLQSWQLQHLKSGLCISVLCSPLLGRVGAPSVTIVGAGWSLTHELHT